MKNGIIKCLTEKQMNEFRQKAFLGVQGIQHTMKTIKRFTDVTRDIIIDEVNWGKKTFADKSEKELFNKIRTEVSVESLRDISAYTDATVPSQYERVLIRELMESISEDICESIDKYIEKHTTSEYLETFLVLNCKFDEVAFDCAEEIVNKEVEALQLIDKHLEAEDADIHSGHIDVM